MSKPDFRTAAEKEAERLRFEQFRNQSKPLSKPGWTDIYERAVKQNLWIFDPEVKRWQSPEEFKARESGRSGGDPKRLERLQIRDPMEGVEAGYLQLQSLTSRMEIFAKRVLAYYKEHK